MKVHFSINLPEELSEEFFTMLLRWEHDHTNDVHLDLITEENEFWTANKLNQLLMKCRPDIPWSTRIIPKE